MELYDLYIMELYDLYKKRYAIVSMDNKELRIVYEFRLNPLSATLQKKNENYKERTFSFAKIDAKLIRKFDGKLLSLTLRCKEANKNLLYQLFLCFVYIVGNRVCLESFVEGFPYYLAPRYFNFRRTAWPSQIQSLILQPQEILENAFNLFTAKNSYFRRLVPILSEINDFSYPDVIFLVEFGVLEGLSKQSEKIGGLCFQRGSDNYRVLKKFSDDATKLLTQYSTICIEVIKKKLSVEKLNHQLSTRQRMEEFIASFAIDGILEYKNFVKGWGELRNEGLAHGEFGGDDGLEKTLEGMEKLHALLVDIVDHEFCGLTQAILKE